MNKRQKEDFKLCLYMELNSVNIGNDIERSAVERAIEIIIAALDMVDLDEDDE